MRDIKISEDIIKKIEKEECKCIGCRLCMKNCPMLEAFCDSPKELLKDLKNSEKADITLPYSCALCNYCTTVCPKDVDLKDIFYGLRAHIVNTEDSPPKELGYSTVKFHQNNSFSKLFSTNIEELSSKKPKRIFFPGCSLSSYSPDIVMKTYKYLREKLPGIGIALKCCGNPTYSMGEIEKFNNLYNSIQDEFEKNEIDEVIVACLNCYKTIKKNSKNLKVVSLWEVISEYGVPKEKKDYYKFLYKDFTIHDPCPTRDEKRIHNSIRDILNQLGIKVTEMEFNRKDTLCCGSGAMIGVTSKELSSRQRDKRANQSESDYIVTYCEECVESMRQGGKKSLHILDLLFNDYIEERFDQEDINTISKWINRYRTKRRINNYDKEE